MRQGGQTDFRDDAAEQSARLVSESRLVNVLDSATSLCLGVEGPDATGALYRIALIPWAWLLIALCVLLFGAVLGVLILTPLVDATFLSIGLSVAGFVLGLVLIVMGASSGDGIFEGVMEARLAGRLADLNRRVDSRHPFCVEDPATYKKLKVISEDYATGGIDRRRPGLLMEGLRYRYVIRPEDVTEFREDGEHFLISYAVRTARVTLALNVPEGNDENERQVIQAIKGTLSVRASC
jgi:hypothetical protein